MKTNIARAGSAGVEHRTVNGLPVVVLKASEYERLREKADEWEPELPRPDANGTYPAVAYARISLARKIIRHRRRLGLTQVELARLARIRPENLNRIEHAEKTPSLATDEKIERALAKVEKGSR